MESIFGVLIYKFAGKNVKVSFFGIFVSVSSYFEQIELFSESKRFSQLLLILQNWFLKIRFLIITLMFLFAVKLGMHEFYIKKRQNLILTN